MARVLFLDESGQDHHESPYEVLGGLAVHDSRIWPLITNIHQAEIDHFGRRISRDEMELKAKKLLKRKVFRLAGQLNNLALTRDHPFVLSLSKDDDARGSTSSPRTVMDRAQRDHV